MKITEQPLPAHFKIEPGTTQKTPLSNDSGDHIFSPGLLLKGYVAGFTGDGKVLLDVDGQRITARTMVPLKLGAELWLETESSGNAPLLTLAAKKGAVQDFLKFFIPGVPLSSANTQGLPDVVASLLHDIAPTGRAPGQFLSCGVAAATNSGQASPAAVKILSMLLGKTAKEQMTVLLDSFRQRGGSSRIVSPVEIERFSKVFNDMKKELAVIFAPSGVKGNVPRSASDPDTLGEKFTRIFAGSENTLASLLDTLAGMDRVLKAGPGISGEKFLQYLAAVHKELTTLLDVLGAQESTLGKAIELSDDGFVIKFPMVQKELATFLDELGRLEGVRRSLPDTACEKLVQDLAGVRNELTRLLEIVGGPDAKLDALGERIGKNLSVVQKELAQFLGVTGQQGKALRMFGVPAEERILQLLSALQQDLSLLHDVCNLKSSRQQELGGAGEKLIKVLLLAEKKVSWLLADLVGKETESGAVSDASGEKLVKIFAAHQEINSLPAQTSDRDFLLFPCFFAGNTGWGEWIFSRGKGEDSRSNEQYSLSFYLEMSMLGPLSLQIIVSGGSMTGLFQLASQKAKSHIEENIPELTRILEKLGYHPVMLTCGISRNNTVAQLKEALEEKAAVQRFSLLDVNV